MNLFCGQLCKHNFCGYHQGKVKNEQTWKSFVIKFFTIVFNVQIII